MLQKMMSQGLPGGTDAAQPPTAKALLNLEALTTPQMVSRLVL